MSKPNPSQASAEPPPGSRDAGDSAATSTAPPLGGPSWGGLIQRRVCWGLTWRGRLVLLLSFLAVLAGAVAGAYPFLAVTEPAPGGLLVVEGWAPDYVLAVAQQEFETRHYDRIYVTGGPLDRGAPLAEFKTYAALGAASLVKMGLDPNVVEVAPAPGVRHDRTYASALALKRWLQERHVSLAQLNVITMGPHARRTRLLYSKAFGPETTVGIMSVPSQDFDPRRWWQSSAGVRTVVSEVIAYAYARVAFNPQTD